eukprot:3941869-Rhodomonas_salina.2
MSRAPVQRVPQTAGMGSIAAAVADSVRVAVSRAPGGTTARAAGGSRQESTVCTHGSARSAGPAVLDTGAQGVQGLVGGVVSRASNARRGRTGKRGVVSQASPASRVASRSGNVSLASAGLARRRTRVGPGMAAARA